MVDTALCIGAHGDTPPLAEPGALLCRRCGTRLRRDLSAIVGLWPLLSVMLTAGSGNGTGRAGKPGSRPPCNLDVADITDPRGAVHASVVGWARIVIEERRLSATPADAEQAARLLAIHADWVTAQPWADEALAELHDVARRIRRVCRDLPEPPLGLCPDIDPRGEAERCGGPLRWHDGSAVVECGRCGSRWTEADLPAILRVVEPARRFPVPRDWVARQYTLTANQIRLWVHRGHVKTYADGQVDLIDVLQRIRNTNDETA